MNQHVRMNRDWKRLKDWGLKDWKLSGLRVQSLYKAWGTEDWTEPCQLYSRCITSAILSILGRGVSTSSGGGCTYGSGEQGIRARNVGEDKENTVAIQKFLIKGQRCNGNGIQGGRQNACHACRLYHKRGTYIWHHPSPHLIIQRVADTWVAGWSIKSGITWSQEGEEAAAKRISEVRGVHAVRPFKRLFNLPRLMEMHSLVQYQVRTGKLVSARPNSSTRGSSDGGQEWRVGTRGKGNVKSDVIGIIFGQIPSSPPLILGGLNRNPICNSSLPALPYFW